MSLGSAERGCGKRQKGGVYAEVPLSPFGKPVEEFLLEPPVELDVEQLGLSPIGVKLLERDGITHVLDWVGESHYPNVADMVEEIRNLGLSRRLPRTLDFSRLTAGSRILLVHRRAFVRNWADVVGAPAAPCPKRREVEHEIDHEETTPCVGVWWRDLEGLEEDGLTRKMPAFDYTGSAPAVPAEYGRPALFASFPIVNLAVIRDPEGKTHESALELADLAGLPVNLEEE